LAGNEWHQSHSLLSVHGVAQLTTSWRCLCIVCVIRDSTIEATLFCRAPQSILLSAISITILCIGFSNQR
jgi:hypothetical protein